MLEYVLLNWIILQMCIKWLDIKNVDAEVEMECRKLFLGGDEETQTLKADVEKRKRQESRSEELV